MSQPAIIMAAYNHLDDFVRENVAAVKANTSEPFTLILIDDNSNDGTGEFFDQQADIALHNDANRGLSVVRNQGLREATRLGADPIVQLDSDTTVHPGWLDEARDCMRATGCWITGMCGCLVTGAPEYKLMFQTGTPAGYPASVRKAVDYVSTCLWVAVGDIVERVGWFDEEYCNWYSEDWDYGLRAWIAGGQCWQTPVPAWHPGGGRTVQTVPEAAVIYSPHKREDTPFWIKWGSPEWMAKWPKSAASGL